jgi:hypothetical protein
MNKRAANPIPADTILFPKILTIHRSRSPEVP